MADERGDQGAGEVVDFRVCAVLPAAGSGVRMGMATPKQFCRILGRPVISYTLEAFERVPWIDEIVVAISEDRLQHMANVLREFKHKRVQLIIGGNTRHRSIYNGIQGLTSDGQRAPDVVIIHDAVRPLVSDKILKDVTIAAKKHGAAGTVRPLVSTVISRSEDGFLDHSLERSKYRASEMPQAFQYDVIYGAYNKCTEYDFECGTECLHLALTYSGTRAMLVEGPVSLWKVTHKKDLYALEAVLKENQSTKIKAVLIGDEKGDIEKSFLMEMKERNIEVTCIPSKCDTRQMSTEIATATVVCNVVRHQSCTTHTEKVQFDDEKPDVMDFSICREALQGMKHCSYHRKAIVNVGLSCNYGNIICLRESTQELNKQGRQDGVCSFGIFVHVADHCNKGVLPSEDCSTIVEMMIESALNTKVIYSGQVFQYQS